MERLGVGAGNEELAGDYPESNSHQDGNRRADAPTSSPGRDAREAEKPSLAYEELLTQCFLCQLLL